MIYTVFNAFFLCFKIDRYFIEKLIRMDVSSCIGFCGLHAANMRASAIQEQESVFSVCVCMCQQHSLQSYLGSLAPCLPSSPCSSFSTYPLCIPPFVSSLVDSRSVRGGGSLHGRVRYNDVAISGRTPNPIYSQSSGYQ